MPKFKYLSKTRLTHLNHFTPSLILPLPKGGGGEVGEEIGEGFKLRKSCKNKLGSLPKTAGMYPHTKGRQSAEGTNFNLNSLPSGVGVYCFAAGGARGGREFLYIGKAVNIRGRVKSHFMNPVFKDDIFILPKTDRIGYIKTNSEIEALLLEAELIKKYRPKYNVIWKDDKNYSFVEITQDEFPKISIVHQTKNKAKYIGPFVDGKAIRQTLRILRRAFPFRTCRTIQKKKCLFYSLKLCPAPCDILVTEKEYKQNIKNLIKILQGKKLQVLKTLKKEMKEMSARQNFEKAAVLRNQIFALENVFKNAHIIKDVPKRELNWAKTEKKLRRLLGVKNKITRIEAYDVSNIQGKEATASMVVFENGRANKKEYKRFQIKTVHRANDIAMLKEALTRRFWHAEWEMPQVILIDGGKAQLNVGINVKCQIKSKMQMSKMEQIKIISLAKRKNELFTEGKDKPILLKNLPQEISNLILQIRDEAHRFAISYHKKLRSRDFFK